MISMSREAGMNSVGKLSLGLATLGILVSSFCSSARAQAAPQGGAVPGPGPDGNFPYQHVPLPKELPKGVTVKDAQSLQDIIDSYSHHDPLTVTKIRGNIYFAKGGPGNDPNMGFVVGKTGVIAVDGKGNVNTEKQALDEIAKITPNPVNTLILLHGNNQGGLTALPTGLTVIAQEAVKKEAENAPTTGRGSFPRSYVPTKTIDKDETMTIDGVRVRLLHWASGCTEGDMAAYFPDQKVVFASALVVNDFPLAATAIDGPLHGSVAGWMEDVRGILALNADIYVSGHGPLFTKRDVRTKLAFIQDKWDKIKVMVAQGKSLDEVKAAIDGPQGNLERTPSTTENIYAELTTK